MPLQTGLLEACRELGVVMLAYSPLGQGRLSGKYSAAHPPPGRRTFSDHPMATVEAVVAELRRIGEAHGGRTPSQVALAYLIAKGAVPIPGAKNGEQSEQNAGALGWRMTDEELGGLDAVALHGKRGIAQRVWQHG
jgi:aryl-alcohol dehydrogenase-like predicted oxidoreductase